MTIPTHFKEVVYFLGVNPDEVVSSRRLSWDPPTWDLYLRKGELEWKGHVIAPPYGPRPPVTHIEDLINDTVDCPHCGGSGKVRLPRVSNVTQTTSPKE